MEAILNKATKAADKKNGVKEVPPAPKEEKKAAAPVKKTATKAAPDAATKATAAPVA